jgi:hypothetical protein
MSKEKTKLPIAKTKWWKNLPFIGSLKEMIGRTNDLYAYFGSDWSDIFSNPTTDSSRPVYALNMAIYKASVVTDNKKVSYGKEYIYGATFGKPIVNSPASFAFAGLKPPRIADEGETADLINNFLYAERKTLFDMMRFGSRDGDAFIRLMTDGDDVWLEMVSPEMVNVITQSDNINNVIGYDITHIVWKDEEQTKKEVIREKYRNESPYYSRVVVDEKGNETVQEESDDLPFLAMVHYANEKDPNAIYGVSDYQNVYVHMRSYHAVMENAIKGTIYNSQPTPVITGIKHFSTFMANNFKKAADEAKKEGDTRYQIKWKPNKMLLLGEGSDMKMVTIPDHVTPATKMLEYLFYCIVQATETPEFVMGTAVQSSKASVSEQVPVMINKAYRKRGDIEPVIYEIIDLYLQFLLKTAQVKQADIDNLDTTLEWPEIVNEDKKLNLELVKTLKELGLITDETALKLTGLKFDDVSEELDKAKGQAVDNIVNEMRKTDIYSPFSAHQYDKNKDIKKEVDDDKYASKRKVKAKK